MTRLPPGHEFICCPYSVGAHSIVAYGRGMDGGAALRERLEPLSGPVPLDRAGLVIAAVLAGVIIGWPPLWRRVRLAVTLVHEAGHALVGVLCGRRFTGFVVSGDASGHAVTVGPVRGLGRIATTWAGYPAPALAGCGLVWAAAHGYAAPLLALLLLGEVLLLPRIRSVVTGVVLLFALAATASAWWWRDNTVQVHALTVLGLVLLAGAWRGLAAVWQRGRAGDDHAVLRRLTGVPGVVWLLSWALVCAAATLVAAGEL